MTGLARDQSALEDMGGLADLPGLETVRDQFTEVVTVIQAENARREAGISFTRTRPKNLVFTGGPGTGKSRAAAAVGRIYRALGVLTPGHLIEVTSTDLIEFTAQDTAKLVGNAARRARGGVLMINDAHAFDSLYPRDRQALSFLLEALTDFRDLVVILAGSAPELCSLLRANPAFAALFPVTIDFPSYTAGQLATIFGALAAEAGFTVTTSATEKASSILRRADDTGNARLAIRLLDEAMVNQAHRIADMRQQDPAELCAIHATDIADRLDPVLPERADEQWPGQYL